MTDPPTCSGLDASFFDEAGDLNYPSRMGQLSTQSGRTQVVSRTSFEEP